MSGAPIIELESSGWRLGVLPHSGASLSHGRVLVDGQWLDLLRPTRGTAHGNPELCSSFPMVPWSNRVRDGLLRFRGRTWTLAHNGSDGTAIHGATRHHTWDVTERTADCVELALDSRALVGVNFPWQFRAALVYALDGDRLTVTTTVENVDAEPFPAGFGHHPYFERRLRPVEQHGTPAPDEESGGSDALLELPFDRAFPLAAGMATGPAGEIPPRADYRTARVVGSAFVDDVLTAQRDGQPAARIAYPDHGLGVRLDMDPVYESLVVYVPRRRAYFAVEPVTNANDGFGLYEDGVPGTGVFVLEPGESRTGAFSLTLER